MNPGRARTHAPRFVAALSVLLFLGVGAAAEEKRADLVVGASPYRGANGGVTHTVASLDAPGVGGPAYAIRGRVRGQGIEGTAYLEMWSDFGERGRFFTRTTGDAGPMAALTGDQAWREFVLPFFPENETPQRLEVNVVLPGAGEVALDSLEVVQYTSMAEASALFGPEAGTGFGGAPLWLLLGGGIGALAALAAVALRRRAARAELRRIAALDAGGGIS